jgi:hypothetical protein
VTEAEWLVATDPRPMLGLLRWGIGGSHRKGRLFATACLHTVWHLLPDGRSRRAVEAAELYADGLITDEARRAAKEAAFEAASIEKGPGWAAAYAAHGLLDRVTQEVVSHSGAAPPIQAELLREIYGNGPFRPARPVDPAQLRWNGGKVGSLAKAIYDDRAFLWMPALANALEDAGCTDAELLGHLRGPGPHVRGCWALDLVLGKE